MIVLMNFILCLSQVISLAILQHKLRGISRNKGIKGTALAVANLLLCVEAYKSSEFTHEKIKMKCSIIKNL